MSLRRIALLLISGLVCLLLPLVIQAEGPLPLIQVTADLGADRDPSIVLADDGKLWLVWYSDRSGNDDIWCKTSSDGGITWSEDRQLTTDAGSDQAPAIAQAADGHLWVVWQSDRSGNNDIWYKTSSDGGATWSSDTQFEANANDDQAPAIAQGGDGRLWVVWRSSRFDNSDIWYRTSSNNGMDWSAALQLTANMGYSRGPSVGQGPDGRLWVFWATDATDGSSYYSSKIWYVTISDGGSSWSAPVALPISYGHFDDTAMATAPDGTLWVAVTDYSPDPNIHIMSSADSGTTWSSFSRFTPFTGVDYRTSVVIGSSGEPIVVWGSDRATNYDIWLGIPGEREDSDPPPHIDWAEHHPMPNPTEDDAVYIKAGFSAYSGIQDVVVVWTRDGVPQPDLALYNDGQHNDEMEGDSHYGTELLGPFPAGTVVEYYLRVRDMAGHVLEGHPTFTGFTYSGIQYPLKFVVQPRFVPKESLLLVADGLYEDPAPLVQYYEAALEARGDKYDLWSTYLRGVPPETMLPRYSAVIWAMPGRGHLLVYPPGSNVANYLGRYLYNGGRLFISGQRVSELDQSDWGRAFHRSYLHARLVGKPGAFTLQGVAGDPIGDGLSLAISGGDGANNQKVQAEIDPLAPAQTVFKYTSGTSSSGSGAIRLDAGTHRVVYLAFGLEAIDNVSERAAVLDRSLDWLDILDPGEVARVRLVPGWNLVSLPISGTVSLSEGLASIEGHYDLVYTWDPTAEGGWKRYEPGGAGWDVDARTALWIRATGEATLSVKGQPSIGGSILLKKGWNLVGFASPVPREVVGALTSIIGKYDRVYTYKAEDAGDPWKQCHLQLPAPLWDLRMMVPGGAYWIHATGDCTWKLP